MNRMQILSSSRREMTSRVLPRLVFVVSIAGVGAVRLASQDAAKGAAPTGSVSKAPAADKELRVPVRFQGLLPGNINLQLEGKFRVEFRIYPSPQGGQPSWRETQEVEAKKGHIDIELGTKTPIPMELHEATYKWLGAAVNGQREVFPRYPIVNVVYASPREALLAHERWQGERREPKSAAYEPSASGQSIAQERGEETTWKEALFKARAKGSDLADYQKWYEKLESLPPDLSATWTGHYEWVLPWVYDTASHGRYTTLFRGRFQGCDYSDLSPQKKYPFRVVETALEATKSKSPANEVSPK